MKVFHVSLNAPGYSSDGIARAFAANGFDYSFFNWQPYRFDNGLPALRMEMIRRAQSEKADIVFLHIQNPEVLDLETARELTKYGFVVNFSFDVRSKEKSQWMYDIAPFIGLTCFACLEDVSYCNSIGIKNTMLLQSSADTQLYKMHDFPIEVTRIYPEIVFIGNRTNESNLNFEKAGERVEMVEFLQNEYGKRFQPFGLGWSGSKFVNPMEEINILNSAKIAIAHNHFLRKGYCSDRQWRSISCGTLTVCQYYEGLEDDFDDSETFSWIDFEDLKLTIDFFLKNEKERKIVAMSQNMDFLERHTWINRISHLKNKIESLRS